MREGMVGELSPRVGLRGEKKMHRAIWIKRKDFFCLFVFVCLVTRTAQVMTFENVE